MMSWELLGHRWFWVLVHSLWQQSLAAIVLWGLLRCFAARGAERRYAMTLGVFTVAALSPVFTWAWMSNSASKTDSVQDPSRIAISEPARHLASGEGDSRSQPIASNSHPTVEALQETRGSSTAAPGSGPSRAWIVLLVCWGAGTSFHLIRAVRDFSATASWLRGSPLCEPALLEQVDRARALLHLRRRFEVLVSPSAVGPFVFGLWRPTLVLPAAVLAGLTPDQLEAVLLHELAHLRRYDDVVNLLQRLMEAVFFFNPALLWMSNVLRREREAACDARAVACTGSPFSLAEALVRVAEALGGEALGGEARPGLASINFADSGDSGALLDRVRRIVRPNERPRLRLAWPALVGTLLFLGLLCLGLERATVWSIALAKDWLSPEQRIAAVAEILGDSAPIPTERSGEKFRLRGTIRTADGAPFADRQGYMHSLSQGGSNSTGSSHYCKGADFDVTVEPGDCWLMYQIEGYAPTIAGPFRGVGGDVKEGIELVLKAGSSGGIRVVDPQGRPIADATVTGLPDWGLNGFVGPSLPEKTDQDGFWKSGNLADVPYRLTIRAPGFSTFNSTKSVKITNEPAVITLDPSDPLRGIVVDSQGNPVSGAKVGILAERRANSQSMYGGLGNEVGVTRDDGTFQIDEVSLDCTYDILIDAGDRGHALRAALRVDEKPVRFELQKKLTLAGQLRDDGSDAAVLRTRHFYCLSTPEGGRKGRDSSATIDEAGRFKFDSLFAGPYQITVGRSVIKGRLEESKDDLVIDLKELQKSERDVEVRFVEGETTVRPGGSIGVQMEIVNEAGNLVFGGPQPIADGVVRFRIRTPGTLHLVPDGCLGYWFAEVDLPVPEGSEPFVAEVPVLPAGAVRVKVLSPAKRGKATPEIGAGIQFQVSTPTGERSFSIHRRARTGDEVALSPIPLDVPCLVSASQEYRRVFSPEFRLEGDAPVRGLTLALQSAVDATIRVESSDGSAISRVPLEVHHEPESPKRNGSRRLSPGGMSWSNNQLMTDRDGQATLVGLAAGEGGYTVIAKPTRDWQPVRTAIRTDGSATTLTLQPGNVLVGKVVDEKTGQGVPGIEVQARLARPKPGEPMEFVAESPTDDDGNFRFSNLPGDAVKLIPWGVSLHSQQDDIVPGAEEPVVLKVQTR